MSSPWSRPKVRERGEVSMSQTEPDERKRREVEAREGRGRK